MQQLKTLYANLSVRQRWSLAAVVVAVVAGLVALVRFNHERDLKPLYSGLSAEDAGQVVAKLKESGVEYRVGEGGTVMVSSARVAELRLQMASAGLPKTGRIGYELFDKANFGQTEFAEQVNYRRALEGELERSVASLAEVESARVHLVFPKDSVFLESRQPAKASVLVKLKAGAKLSPANVNAIAQLTANAVEGLTPESVSVLDMSGALLNPQRKAVSGDGADQPEESLAYRERLERVLLAKVNTTLEPLLGADRFRAGVAVECDFSSGEQSEENFDPAKSVMTSSQKSEDSSTGSSAAGVPGTASALPRPSGRTTSATGLTRRSEQISYQTSRTVKRLKIPQGSIKRLSVSVLLDQRVRWEGTGPKAKRILEVPTPEKIKAIHDVVAGVTGVVTERGDQVVVESLPFDATLNGEPPAGPVVATPQPATKFPPWVPVPLRNPVVLGGICVGILALLAGVVLVLRRRKAKKGAAASAHAELAGNATTALDGETDPVAQLQAQLAQQSAAKDQQFLSTMEQFQATAAPSNKAAALARHLTEETGKNPEAAAQLIRTWLTEPPR